METGWFAVFLQPLQTLLCDGKSSALCFAFVVLQEEFKMARRGLVLSKTAGLGNKLCPQVEKKTMEKKTGGGGGGEPG